jgi:antitoxin VapB
MGVVGMSRVQRARIFMNGRSQAMRIPAEFRVSTEEVFVQRDEKTGDLIVSQRPPLEIDWGAVYAELDAARFPEDFMAERDQGTTEVREPL